MIAFSSLRKIRFCGAIFSLLILFPLFSAFGGVPALLNFQGRIVIGGVSFNGTGQFQFALVDNTGTNTFWSNDGTGSGGGEPTAAVSLVMTNGLYAVVLGDTNVSGMPQPIDPGTFTNGDVRVRVWFNDGTHGFEQLSPDQRIVAAGYSIVAQTANNFLGIVSSAQLPGNLATTNFVLGQNFVTAAVTNGLASVAYVNSSTNGFVSAAITNGLATLNYVNAATNGFVTAAVTNGLATIGYVNTLTNGFVTATITNGFATTNFVLAQGYLTAAATNGFVSASITNGLASTNFVLSQGFVTGSITNGLVNIVYLNAATNGFVSATITNGLATTNYVRTATNGFVSASVTNGLATTNFVLSQGYLTAVVTNGLATVAYVNASTNGFVSATITNGLATTNYALAIGLNGTNFTVAVSNSLASQLAGKSGTNISYAQITNAPAIPSTNGFVTAAITNGLATTNYVLTQGYLTSAATNGLATTNYVRTATNGFVSASITNSLATTNFVLTQGFVTTAVTNGLATTNYVQAVTNTLRTAPYGTILKPIALNQRYTNGNYRSALTIEYYQASGANPAVNGGAGLYTNFNSGEGFSTFNPAANATNTAFATFFLSPSDIVLVTNISTGTGAFLVTNSVVKTQ
jgi:hypothetical protein